MKLVDRTAPSQNHTLTFDVDLAHAPSKVWRALTDPVLLAEWLLPVVGIALEPGTTFTFEREPIGGWDGKVHCRMLEVEPQKLLRYAWVVGDMDTTVTFTLTPVGNGTRLTIEHAGFNEAQKQNFAGARYGWKQMGDKLVMLLETTA